jgi:hypothetical protein
MAVSGAIVSTPGTGEVSRDAVHALLPRVAVEVS